MLDDDRYHTYDAEARGILEPISEDWFSKYEGDGYYHVLFNFEREEKSGYIWFVNNLYGFNAHESSNVPFEIQTDDFTLNQHETKVREDDIRIADETGLVLVPMFEEVSSDTYTLSVYYADLTSLNPELSLVTEKEVDSYDNDRARVMFNANGTGCYITHTDGTMNFFDLK